VGRGISTVQKLKTLHLDVQVPGIDRHYAMKNDPTRQQQGSIDRVLLESKVRGLASNSDSPTQEWRHCMAPCI